MVAHRSGDSVVLRRCSGSLVNDVAPGYRKCGGSLMRWCCGAFVKDVDRRKDMWWLSGVEEVVVHW